jgi:AcrR family transcriptional regulator
MNKSAPGRRGRRPGNPDTRAAVLDVARRRFLADGYQAVTLRSIAAEAGVDVALVSYFFGSKRGLFAAVMTLSVNPADVLAAALPGELSTLPERLLYRLIAAWDDAQRSAPMRAMIVAAVNDDGVARLLREAVEGEMIARLAQRIGGPDATVRAAVATLQTVGLIFQRYVLRLEPLASMPADELVARLAPAMRAALAPTSRSIAGRHRTRASRTGP